MLLNLVFSLLAIFHLTYLGSMFDPGVDEQEVEEVRAPRRPSSKREEYLLSLTVVPLMNAPQPPDLHR